VSPPSDPCKVILVPVAEGDRGGWGVPVLRGHSLGSLVAMLGVDEGDRGGWDLPVLLRHSLGSLVAMLWVDEG